MPTLATLFTLPALRSLQVSLPLGSWIRVARERRQLARLSPRQLADIGIDSDSAMGEAARPFWDLPKRGC